jgi:hypothetical protein
MTDQSPTGLPPSLERFQGQLEAAARRDVKRSLRLRPTLIRVTAVCVTAAAAVAVLSAVGVFGKNGPSLVDQAAAALAPKHGSVLHMNMLGSQNNGDGTTVNWSDESWQAGTAPFDRRQIETSPEGTRVETAMVDGVTQVYDPVTDTIYVDTQAKPVDTKAPTPAPSSSSARAQQQRPTYPWIVSVGAATGGKVTVTIESKAADGSVKRSVQVMKKADLKALAKKLDEYIVSGASTSDSGTASAGAPSADSAQDPFRAEILALLQSGKVHEDGRPTVDGRDLIRFVSNDGHATYLVDATTYNPVEWQTTGDGGGTTLSFVAYENVPTSEGSDLLSLTAQHPGVRVDRDPAHFAEVSGRLFPNG